MSQYYAPSSPAMPPLTGPDFLEAGFSLSLPPTPNLDPSKTSSGVPIMENFSLDTSKMKIPAQSEGNEESEESSQATPSNEVSSAASAADHEDVQEGEESGSSLLSSAKNSSDKSKFKWSTGRVPWYDECGNRNIPLIIGVTGGSASGKTSVCEAIVEKLNIPWVQLLSMDRFYKSLTPEQMELAHKGSYNFDHPDAFDLDGLKTTIEEIKTGKVVEIPIYDFSTHSRLKNTDRLYGVDVVIVEGILVLYDEKVRNLLDLQIYVDTDSDYRLARRIGRDVRERGRTVDGVLSQYMATVKPSFEQYILPTKRHADIIIPWNTTNHIAVDLISQHIVTRLEKRGKEHIRTSHRRFPGQILQPSQLPSTVYTLEPTHALKCIQTAVRDNSTPADQWRFELERLVNLVVSNAMNVLKYDSTTVTTPTNSLFEGIKDLGRITTVSIFRTGQIFEDALRSILPDSSHGTIVIYQSSSHKVEYGPRLYSANLPKNITLSDGTVMLFDGVLATGGAVNMAIHVLLDHGVLEEQIVFCCLIAAPEGLYRLISNFPKLRIVVSWVDNGLDNKGFCSPGMGYLGDRYFGTQTFEKLPEK